MRKSTLVSLSTLLLSLVGTTDASAGFFRPGTAPVKSSVGFNSLEKAPGSFIQKAVDENGVMTPDVVLEGNYIAELEPVGTLFSPKGEHWFYKLDFEGDQMEGSNQYYTKWNFKRFKVTVYDGKFNVVGYSYGAINFPENAYRCNRINVASQVTSTFFNSNSSDYEIIVDFNFNPDETKYLYGAKQHSQVYTLQTEMPEEVQTPVFECPGILQGVINGSTTTTEGFILSFAYESTWDNEPDEKNKLTLRVYKPAPWGKKPELIAQQTTAVDTNAEGINDAIPFFVVAHGSDIYSIRSYYEKPLFDYSDEENPKLTPDNHFVVEFYKPDAQNPIISDNTDPNANPATPWKRVLIPVEIPTDPEFPWRCYAVGNFLGDRDITWDFSTGDEPCLIVTIVDSNVQEDSKAYYRVYDLDANVLKEFGTASNSYTYFSSLEGQSEQIGFDVLNEEGSSVMQLVNWPSLEIKGEIPSLFEHDGNIYQLSSVPTRILGEGGVLYAANAMPTSSSGASALAYIVYFYPDGTIHHMDTLNLPENTAKAYAFIEAEVLDPYLYNTDSKYEYLIWLYSWKDASEVGTDLSLCVVDDQGKVLAKHQLANGHSNENAYVSNCPDKRFIVLTWRDASSRTNPALMELISLPLNKFEGEGTVENPYLIKTFGDFDQVRNNLTSHFALANDIDMENRAFRPIDGTFTGSIDGRNHIVKNLYLTTTERGAIFNEFGQRPADEEETAASAVIKNITFNGVDFYREGTQFGTKPYSILAVNARYAEFDKVNVVNPVVNISGVNVNFGVFATVADNVKVTDCSVKDADINLERGTGVAGFVSDARGSEFKNILVTGSIKGRTNVGGVIGITNSYSTSVENAHVNAQIEATTATAGGVIGANNSRSTVRNSIVEGTLTASSSAGGIIGRLEKPETPEAADVFIIEKNVVNIDAINAGDEPEYVHRVVGYSSIDEGETTRWVENPDWDGENPDEAGSYETVPATPEEHIGTNYVISALNPFDATEGLVTEGTTTSLEENEDLFTDLGFAFGSSTDAPWTTPNFMNPIPALYFESTVGLSMSFNPAAYTGTEDTVITVNLSFDGFDIAEAIGSGFVSMESSDEEIAYFNGFMDFADASTLALQVQLGKEGTAVLSMTYNGLAATATVTVTKESGITDVTVENAVTYAGGIVNADGCAIEIYDVQGRLAAAGHDSLSTENLVQGIYIVRATAADGKTSVLKISVE